MLHVSGPAPLPASLIPARLAEPLVLQTAIAAAALLAETTAARTPAPAASRKRPREDGFEWVARKRPRRHGPGNGPAEAPRFALPAAESELEPLHPDFLGHGDPGGDNAPYFPDRPPARAALLAREQACGSTLLTFDATGNDFSKCFVGMHATACREGATRHFTVVSGRNGRRDPRFPGKVVFDLLVRPRRGTEPGVAGRLLAAAVGETLRFFTPCTTGFRGVNKDTPVVRCVVGSGMGPLHADLETRLQTDGPSAPVIGCVQMKNRLTRHIYDRIRAQYADPRLRTGRLWGIYSDPGESLDGRGPGRLDTLLRRPEVAYPVIDALLLPRSHFYASGIDSIPGTVENALAETARARCPALAARLLAAIADKKGNGRWHSEGTPDTLRTQSNTQGE